MDAVIKATLEARQELSTLREALGPRAVDDKDRRIAELEAVLRELVSAVDEQQVELDPSDRLVRAMRDAKSWIR